MKMLFRLFWLIFTQSRRSRADVMGPVDTTLRVYPNDLDIFMHVNNGVYLTYADLGRTDLMLRADVFHEIRKAGWYPVVAAETITFKKSLKLGQRFTITTRILGWDDRAIYLEQVFSRSGTFIARAVIDARFLSRAGGKVSIDELYKLVGMTGESPPLPESLKLWIRSNAPNPDAPAARQAAPEPALPLE